MKAIRLLALALFTLLVGLPAAAQAQNTFANTGSLSVWRSGHTTTLLPDGTVLLAGGI
jgi:hypothetical protein